MTKKLYRSKSDRVFAGVCGGIADYFKIESVVIRVVTFVVLAVSGWGIFLYLLLWFTVQQTTSKSTDKKTALTNLADKIEEKVKKTFKI